MEVAYVCDWFELCFVVIGVCNVVCFCWIDDGLLGLFGLSFK